MAEHNLFKGGRATSRLDHSMLPSDTYNVRQKMIDYTLEHL